MNFREWLSNKSNIFLFYLILFIIGVGVGNFIFLDLFFIFVFSLFLLTLFIFRYSSKESRLVILGALFLILGMWRFQIGLPDLEDSEKIYSRVGEKVEFIATVQKVDERINYQKLTVASQNNGGQVLVSTSLYPKYFYGDHLQIKCDLKKPEAFDDFDYEKYLARYNIYAICSFGKIKKIGDDNGSIIFSFIHRIKDRLSQSLNLSIPEPQVSILQAMILGNRRGIPQYILDQFSSVGVSHIIAISGMHIAIIVMILMSMVTSVGIRRQRAFWLVSALIILYVLLIGAPASAVRAGIMGLLILYAGQVGRLSNSPSIILLAASLMLMFNPKLLMSDMGFQLSFMAVVGIIYVSPILKNYFSRFPDWGPVKEIIIVTLSAQIMTLPLIIFYFNRVSLVATLANILILPIIPLVMIWGLINSIVGSLFIPLGRILGFVLYLVVSYILKMVDLLSQLPMSSFEIKNFNIFLVIMLYGVIFYWLVKKNNNI